MNEPGTKAAMVQPRIADLNESLNPGGLPALVARDQGAQKNIFSQKRTHRLPVNIGFFNSASQNEPTVGGAQIGVNRVKTDQTLDAFASGWPLDLAHFVSRQFRS